MATVARKDSSLLTDPTPNNSRGGKQSENHRNQAIHEDTVATFRHYFEHPDVLGTFSSVKGVLQPILVEKLRNISKSAWDSERITVQSGQETAAAIDLLKLFNTSNPGLEEVGRRASQGAKLLEEGEKLVKEGKSMLHTAFKDIPNHL